MFLLQRAEKTAHGDTNANEKVQLKANVQIKNPLNGMCFVMDDHQHKADETIATKPYANGHANGSLKKPLTNGTTATMNGSAHKNGALLTNGYASANKSNEELLPSDLRKRNSQK